MIDGMFTQIPIKLQNFRLYKLFSLERRARHFLSTSYNHGQDASLQFTAKETDPILVYHEWSIQKS